MSYLHDLLFWYIYIIPQLCYDYKYLYQIFSQACRLYRIKLLPIKKEGRSSPLSLWINQKNNNFYDRNGFRWALPCIARLGKPPNQHDQFFSFIILPSISQSAELCNKLTGDLSPYLILKVLLYIFFVIQLCCEIQQNNYCDYADYQRSQHTALVVEVRTVEAVGHII